MTFQEVIANAKTCIGTKCHACPVCNGKACRNTMPGPGSKGVGDTAIRNYDKWQVDSCLLRKEGQRHLRP